MNLKSLKLTNFRNYNDLSLDLSPGINIFIGNNGSGKTNILEAIYVLSLTKSSRYGSDTDLIKQGENKFNIAGEVVYDDYVKKYEVVYDKLKKYVYINSLQVKKISDYISKFCITSFLPNDIEIIKGAPNIRRNILNIQIGMLYNNYLTYLNEYNSLLKMRNEYLRRLNLSGFADVRYLDVINQKMIDISVKIYYFRFLYFNEINQMLPNIYNKLAKNKNIFINYLSSINVLSFDEEQIRKSLSQKYEKNFNKEMMQGMTLTGVHRDDFGFFINGLDAKIYASEGQQRLIVIAYKIAELLVFKKIKNEYPVLLLDDVFSEIDIKRRNNIVKYFKEDIQVIITTTDLEKIQKDLVEKAKIFKIKDGKITNKGGVKKCKKKE